MINKITPHTETSTEDGKGEVELYNMGKAPVKINQWFMRDILGNIIGTIDNEEIAPSGFLAVGVTGLTRNYQEITLFDSGGSKIDSIMYTGAKYHNGLSYARVPDGANTWKWMK